METGSRFVMGGIHGVPYSEPVNSYLLYTRDGRAFVVAANFSHVAIAKVEAFARDRVSCWFMGEKVPANAITLK